jgi:hypothetical protein
VFWLSVLARVPIPLFKPVLPFLQLSNTHGLAPLMTGISVKLKLGYGCFVCVAFIYAAVPRPFNPFNLYHPT